MSSPGPRIRPPLPVLPVVTSRYHYPEPAEYSSVSRPSSSSSSGYWPSPSPSATSYACHSASSSQSSFEACAHAYLRSRAPRPLPQIPSSPSVSVHSPSNGALAYPRPLPIPPPQSPPLFREPGPSTQHIVRPLPAPRSPDRCNSPSHPTYPTSPISLHISLPCSSLTAGEDAISPFSPMSPIVFRSAAEPEVTSPEEERVSHKLSAAAIDKVQPASVDENAPQRHSQDTILETKPETDTVTLRLSDCEDVQMTVELVPLSPTAKRTSRFWTVEKKGRRWVEDDYTEILHELRML